MWSTHNTHNSPKFGAKWGVLYIATKLVYYWFDGSIRLSKLKLVDFLFCTFSFYSI